MFTQTSYLLLTFKDFHLKIHDNRSFVVDAEITYRPFLTSLLHTNREKKLDFKNSVCTTFCHRNILKHGPKWLKFWKGMKNSFLVKFFLSWSGQLLIKLPKAIFVLLSRVRFTGVSIVEIVNVTYLFYQKKLLWKDRHF